MDYETSAGGVIVRRIKNIWQILLLKDKNGEWTFPKGLIEKGEDRKKTAEREIAEEVGVKKLKPLEDLSPITYWYRWEGRLIKKKVYYYIFLHEGTERPMPQREEGILDVKWFVWDDALKVVGYKKTNEKILEEARLKLKNYETKK